MFKNALVSVSDKTGLVDFLKPLVKQGLRVVSTGGTASHLESHGVPVVHVSQQTGFPEVMDGRVRTLHPHIHMALLGRATNPEDMNLLRQHGLEPFDLVIGNLYPFEAQLKEQEPLEELVEYIDIGGPALLRAAAKNFPSITVICDPKDYSWILEKNDLSRDERQHLAAKVFGHISGYDGVIAATLAPTGLPKDLSIGGTLVQELRYGENPQQTAGWYRRRGASVGLHQAQILQGKALSFNNILDLEAAVSVVRDLKEPAAVAVKHNNPCGVAVDKDPEKALEQALAADPVSVFGGIVAINRPLTDTMAERLAALFLECIIVPRVSDSARSLLEKKKNLRVLVWPEMMSGERSWDVRSVSGGFLVQTSDQVEAWSNEWSILGEKPSEDIKRDLSLAWTVVRHLKSNAITLVSEGRTVGLGMGQVNRVEAVEHAIHRMKTHHNRALSPVLASDAFFPFADSIERIAAAGIRWVIQPGGSIKDQEVIECAQRLKVNLILTGKRHFKH